MAEKKIDLDKMFGKDLAEYDLSKRDAKDVVLERLTNSKALLDNPEHKVKNKKAGGADNPTTPRACWKLKGKRYQVWAVYGKKRLTIKVDKDGKVLNCLNATSTKDVHAHLDNLIQLTELGHFDTELAALKAEEVNKLEKARAARK